MGVVQRKPHAPRHARDPRLPREAGRSGRRPEGARRMITVDLDFVEPDLNGRLLYTVVAKDAGCGREYHQARIDVADPAARAEFAGSVVMKTGLPSLAAGIIVRLEQQGA